MFPNKVWVLDELGVFQFQTDLKSCKTMINAKKKDCVTTLNKTTALMNSGYGT